MVITYKIDPNQPWLSRAKERKYKALFVVSFFYMTHTVNEEKSSKMGLERDH